MSDESKIDLFGAYAISGGEPVTVGGHGLPDLSIRRDFTAAEVIEIINLHTETGALPTLADQITAVVAALSDSKPGAQKKFCDALIDMPLILIQTVTLNLSVAAGIRAADGSFIPGAPL